MLAVFPARLAAAELAAWLNPSTWAHETTLMLDTRLKLADIEAAADFLKRNGIGVLQCGHGYSVTRETFGRCQRLAAVAE